MKPTADQVIQEFDELSVEDKQRVYVTIIKRNSIPPSVVTDEPRDLGEKNETNFVRPLNPDTYDEYEKGVRENYQKSYDMPVQKILWKNILINFMPNRYVQGYEELWRVESILGSDIVRNSLRKHHNLDASFIEHLFGQAPYFFYVNQQGTCLFSEYGDLSESNGGPLKRITALDALQRYGLKLIEESKEKLYVRL